MNIEELYPTAPAPPRYLDRCTKCKLPCAISIIEEGPSFRRRSQCCLAPTIAITVPEPK